VGVGAAVELGKEPLQPLEHRVELGVLEERVPLLLIVGDREDAVRLVD